MMKTPLDEFFEDPSEFEEDDAELDLDEAIQRGRLGGVASPGRGVVFMVCGADPEDRHQEVLNISSRTGAVMLSEYRFFETALGCFPDGIPSSFKQDIYGNVARNVVRQIAEVIGSYIVQGVPVALNCTYDSSAAARRSEYLTAIQHFGSIAYGIAIHPLNGRESPSDPIAATEPFNTVYDLYEARRAVEKDLMGKLQPVSVGVL